MTAKSALILGATGAVGKNLLKELLASPMYTRVGEFGRRTTGAAQLEGLPQEKLVQKVIDYDNLDTAGLSDEKWDVVFITLGTTRKQAGSDENFLKIDRDYVINAARAAKVSGETQQVIYCSAIGSDPKSRLLYSRSKGQTENGLAALGYSDTIVFRPAALTNPERGDSRPLESAFNVIANAASHLSDSIAIPVTALAKSMCNAGAFGSADALPSDAQPTKGGDTYKFTIISNKGAVKLAKVNVGDNVKS